MSYPGIIHSQSHAHSHSHSPHAHSPMSQSSPVYAPTAALIESLILSLPYSDRARVVTDVLTLLHQSNSLKPAVQSHTANTGTALSLLSLSGTVPIYYKGSTYHIPVLVWIPYEFPYRPPIVYVTPTVDMRIKDRHKHVDSAGVVYLPYLNQWTVQSSLVDLIIVVSTIFSEDPPVFKVSSSHSSMSSGSVNNSGNSHKPHSSPQSLPLLSPALGPSVSLPSLSSSPSPQSQSQPHQQVLSPRSHHRAQLLASLNRTAQSQLRDYSAQSSQLMDSLINDSEALRIHHDAMTSDMKSMMEEIHLLESQLSQYQSKVNEIQSFLSENDSGRPTINDIDKYFQCSDSFSQALLALIGDDLSIDDTLSALDRALNDGVIELKDYVKNIRQLARQQFMTRALIEKITKIHNDSKARSPPPPQRHLQPALQHRVSLPNQLLR